MTWRRLFDYLSGCLRVLFTPGCWLQNDIYSKIWDDKLNELMKSHEFNTIDGCTASIGKYVVWTANHPYASFSLYRPRVNVRPKRITVLKAGDLFLKHRIAEVEKLL